MTSNVPPKMKHLFIVKCTKVPTNAFHTDVVQENVSDAYLMSEPCMRWISLFTPSPITRLLQRIRNLY